ncbi:TPA: cupin domain-containing protein [Clostridioides difficile]|nr:cupin domain-containing protein [Clostridioides difficile]HDJ1470941.1 cupin domain-containing protein [Clostridioides difficile]
MNDVLNNIENSKIVTLKEDIIYQEGQILHKTLMKNTFTSITLFSFAKGEAINTHKSDGDIFVFCLDGLGVVTIDGNQYELKEGKSIIMPYQCSNAIFAIENFKVLLVMLF